MSVIYIDRTIDCTKDNYKCEKVTGYEHGVKVFRLKPLNDKVPIDLTDCTGAAYVGTKADGKIIGNACEIKDNKVLLPLSLQMTTARGMLKGHIELYYPTGTLKFFGVNFEVFPSPETAEIESKDEFTLLESKIAEVNKIIEEGIETAQGKSAYEIAVENGFEGTVEEWLESLVGAKGDPGTDGKSITSTEINESGELVLTYSDGSTANVGVIKGKDGTDYVLTDADKTDIANIANPPVRLISEIELTERVKSIKISEDSDGNPLDLSKIVVHISNCKCVTTSDTETNIKSTSYLKINNDNILLKTISSTSESIRNLFVAEYNGSQWICYGNMASGNSYNTGNLISSVYNYANQTKAQSVMIDLSNSQHLFDIGTKFTIYGA